MLKKKMSRHSLNDRNLFVRKLLSAGWDPRGWEELFESGVNLFPEAQAEYQNKAFKLRLGYYVEHGYISLECMGRDDSACRSFRFYFKNEFVDIVDALIEVQDTLSVDNYADFVKSMIPACKLVLLETSDELVQLSL